jgi:hypothetical protein
MKINHAHLKLYFEQLLVPQKHKGTIERRGVALSTRASNSGCIWYECWQAPNGYPEVFHDFSLSLRENNPRLQPFQVAIHIHSSMQQYTNNAVQTV